VPQQSHSRRSDAFIAKIDLWVQARGGLPNCPGAHSKKMPHLGVDRHDPAVFGTAFDSIGSTCAEGALGAMPALSASSMNTHPTPHRGFGDGRIVGIFLGHETHQRQRLFFPQ
jgi:hypothetical protein